MRAYIYLLLNAYALESRLDSSDPRRSWSNNRRAVRPDSAVRWPRRAVSRAVHSCRRPAANDSPVPNSLMLYNTALKKILLIAQYIFTFLAHCDRDNIICVV